MTDPTTATESGPTTETESGPTTETESGPTTETESGPTTDTDPTDTDTATTGEPADGFFFRLSAMDVRDPHFFADTLLGCEDVTDEAPLGMPGVNDQFNEAIMNDTDGDGNLDLSLLLLFRDDPIMQQDGGSGDVDFANGECLIPFANTVCDIRPGSMLTSSTYNSQASGVCHEADPTHLSPMNYTPAPGSTMGPCFHMGPLEITIVTTDFDLVLQNAEIAAQYVGDPATELVSGTLRGFMTTSQAENTPLPPDLAMNAGVDTVAGLLAGHADCCAGHDDTDDGGSGWWFYVDFEAEPVPWNGP